MTKEKMSQDGAIPLAKPPVVRNALALSHEYVRKVVGSGDLVVDATAGNGHDTAFLAELAGPDGLVLAFDVQEDAIRRTRDRLETLCLLDRCRLFAEGHELFGERLDGIAPGRPLAAVMFNLGYLPGADHALGTKAPTTIAALQQAMARLRPGGLATVALYYGGDSGFEERDAVLRFVESIDVHAFAVQKTEMVNSRSCPPIFLCIEKLSPGKVRPPA